MSEGNAYTNLLKLMKRRGYNKDFNMTIGKIEKLSPLEIDIGGLVVDESIFYKTETFKKASKSRGDHVLVLIENNEIVLMDKVVT